MLFKTKSPPKRFRARRKRHEITCGECGRKDSVKFHPKGLGPILCTVCYRKKKDAEKKKKEAERSNRSIASKT